MIVDQRQLKWVMGTAVVAAVSLSAYAVYVVRAPNGPSGRSVMGIIFGSLGTAFIVFEYLLSLRKKYPASPLGRVSAWLRAHVWLGLLSFLIILLHSGFRWGHGLAAALMWLFLIVVLSGIIGIVLQNYLPRRMKELVERETVFEQIPLVVLSLRVEADERVEFITAELKESEELPEYEHAGGVKVFFDETQKLQNAEKLQAVAKRRKESSQIRIDPDARDALRDHYIQEIRPFLVDHPKTFPSRLFRTRELIEAYFKHLCTLMPLEAHQVLQDLQDICEERRQLLLQRRMHSWLHGWLLVHVPVSVAFLPLIAVHAVLALRY